MRLRAAWPHGLRWPWKASKRGIRAVAEQRALDRFTDGHRVADFDMMAAETMGSEDLKEGLAALREHRRPRLQGTVGFGRRSRTTPGLPPWLEVAHNWTPFE